MKLVNHLARRDSQTFDEVWQIRRQAFGTRWLVVSFRMAQHVASRYDTFAETF